MSPRAYLELGLVALVALTGWGYVHQRDERLRAEGRLELLRAAADSTAEVADAAVARSIGAEAAAEEATRREEAVRAAGGRRAEAATARAPAAADSVVAAAAPPDSAAVRAAVQALQRIYDERDAARLDQLRADSVIIAELRALDVTRVAAIASLQAALSASQAEAAAALAARPGWLERNLPKVGIVAGAVLGWLAHAAVSG